MWVYPQLKDQQLFICNGHFWNIVYHFHQPMLRKTAARQSRHENRGKNRDWHGCRCTHSEDVWRQPVPHRSIPTCQQSIQETRHQKGNNTVTIRSKDWYWRLTSARSPRSMTQSLWHRESSYPKVPEKCQEPDFTAFLAFKLFEHFSQKKKIPIGQYFFCTRRKNWFPKNKKYVLSGGGGGGLTT